MSARYHYFNEIHANLRPLTHLIGVQKSDFFEIMIDLFFYIEQQVSCNCGIEF